MKKKLKCKDRLLCWLISSSFQCWLYADIWWLTAECIFMFTVLIGDQYQSSHFMLSKTPMYICHNVKTVPMSWLDTATLMFNPTLSLYRRLLNHARMLKRCRMRPCSTPTVCSRNTRTSEYSCSFLSSAGVNLSAHSSAVRVQRESICNLLFSASFCFWKVVTSDQLYGNRNFQMQPSSLQLPSVFHLFLPRGFLSWCVQQFYWVSVDARWGETSPV